MLRIKEFAKLCGCTASLLRYYDQKDILKPHFVESFTGYRYYQYDQALEFHRIKQLQEAGLSIKEIETVKDKSEDEMIEILKEKLVGYQQMVASIQKLIQTYQESKMEMEMKIKEMNAKILKAEPHGNELVLTQNSESITLKFVKDTTAISKLINDMQKQNLLGFDGFDEFKGFQDKTWNYTEIISGWKTKEELIERVKEVDTAKELCIHLLYIDETIDLFAVAAILDAGHSKGYPQENSFFNIGISSEQINRYSILYVDAE